MHRKYILNIIALFCFSAICGAYENPNIGNQNPNVGSPFNVRNAPTQSGQQQRYITRGNPYGKSANDIVTGNVGGGKHFRGVVPYGSSYYSGAYTTDSGTGSVNDFIRRSQDPIVNDRNPGQIRTFVDPGRSVSSMRRYDGMSGLSNPQLTAQGQKTNPYKVPSYKYTPPVKYERPFTDNNMTLDQILARREQLKEEAQKRKQESDEEIDQENEETSDIKNFFKEPLIPELLKKNQEDLQKEKTEKTNKFKEDNVPTDTLTEDQQLTDELATETENEEASEAQKTNKPDYLDLISPKSDLVPEVDDQELQRLSAEGRKVLGEHKTFKSLADEKFSGFMDTAESFIKEKKYYKAADTYALAIIWKPEDARGYLGQSFSLFAAGEYMSSAYYLSRAFELNSKAATKKYDLPEFVGNRDTYENRIVELTQ